MKSCLSIFLILICSSFNFAAKAEESFLAELLMEQEAPFYFLKPVPPTIKLPDKIDLSFFRNQSIVSEYRYRLEIPPGGATAIDRNFTRWSPWISFDFIEFVIPILDREGGYKLDVEYKSSKGGEILKFEKLFYVYRVNPGTYVETAKTETPSVSGKTVSKPLPPIDKPVIKTQTVTNNTASKTKTGLNLNSKRLTPSVEKIVIKTHSIALLALNHLNQEEMFADYKKPAAQETNSNDEVIEQLKNKGISINETDNNGNSPLHTAILSGESEYAISLINQGADLTIKNKLELSPLHLAAFLNERQVTNQLILKGAEVDIKGNSGYTPLHIASELNHVRLAKDLLNMGANSRVRTDQKLTPEAIAKIQNNNEMAKLISKKGSFTLESPMSNSTGTNKSLNYAKLSPKYDFRLPYDKGLLKRRQFNKIAGIISIPVFAISTAGAAYFRSEANNFYSSYKSSETIEIAKHYYDKTLRYDTFTYISGGVSLVSAFGIVNSAIRKKSISNKMRKIFY